MKKITITCIPPIGRNDYLTDTVFDGLASMQNTGEQIDIIIPNYLYPSNVKFPKVSKFENVDFILKAKTADLILLFNAGSNINEELANQIDCWDKTFFIDGSELGKNRRLDKEIIDGLENGTYVGGGAIRFDLLEKCAGYFRREPPYIKGIIPLPFGIERKYIKYNQNIKKDIDFVCIFGQEDYPPLRKEVRLALEDFCIKNNFSYRTKQTKIPFFNIYSSFAKNKFYKTLARAKVGISVAGGGFDTLRMWEVLGNNCMLLTDKIGIYPKGSDALNYERIWQFDDLNDFKAKLNDLGNYLKNEYNAQNKDKEYLTILNNHSTKARMELVINEAKKKGFIYE